ncbi:DUF6160 family protein [Atopomonas sediminilitoris]|uniref:DUF6160 family protein n=1 Tax=Atopomonas sediminilitoris TaxID=2919919 RepID=UPI001F4DCAA2|nr:DUF6160 family protein [Atopomonas sediminilitoris]MCJ8170022.1 hypothetical protein [Atopomonas sediminilitoris]
MRKTILTISVLMANSALAMQALDDDALADVSGQAGISLETVSSGVTASKISYSQDGQSLNLNNVSVGSDPRAGSQTTTTRTVDVVDGRVVMQSQSTAKKASVASITMAGSSNSFGAVNAFYTLGSTLKVKGGGSSGVSGIDLDGSRLSLTSATLYYRDNGHDLIVDGVSLDAYLNAAYIDVINGGSGSEIQLNLGTSRFVGQINGIRMDLAQNDPATAVTPSTPDTRDPNATRSFGSLSMDLSLGGSIRIAGGGASGDGLRIKPNISFSNSLFQYQDTGILRAENFSGTIISNSGITLDLASDARGPYAQLAFADLNLNTTFGGLIMGNPTNQKLGSLGLDLNFVDQGSLKNWLKLRPGGATTSAAQGVTADVSWNMANSSAVVTDNGNSMWFSGLKTNGTGTFTLDLTKGCGTGGVSSGCYAGTSGNTDPSKGNYNGHFDGLRIGLNNVVGSYSFDGLRVGSPTAPLQGGTELLVLAEIFPAYDFTLNGHFTLLAGGSSGNGVRYNADLFITDARAALTVDETGKGLWLSGTNYEMHFRNGSVDVTNNGIELNKGEYWSKLDVNDVRWGNKTTGTSLGRLVLKRYELGSTLAVSSGGAGALCVGGTGTNPGTCSASGGRWEDRGNEGITAKLKNVWVKGASSTANVVVGDEKRNQIIWETSRSGGNGTGSQLVVDNLHTADGNASTANGGNNTGGTNGTNAYGFNVDLNLDVAPTKVKNKTTGQYVNPDPLGFAVNGRVHFKEINIDRVQHVHPTGGAVTSMYGVKLQNADISANMTATPIN